MEKRVYFMIFVLFIFSAVFSGYEVINISRASHFEQGIFFIDSVRFHVFDINDNGDKSLIYHCNLCEGNNWQVLNDYVDVQYDSISHDVAFDFHNGIFGIFNYYIYQPITGVYIEEAKYQLRDDEIFNLRAMHQQAEMQNIQGHILGNKIKLSSLNNWTKINDDGSGFKYDEDGFRMYLPNDDSSHSWLWCPWEFDCGGGSPNGCGLGGVQINPPGGDFEDPPPMPGCVCDVECSCADYPVW